VWLASYHLAGRASLWFLRFKLEPGAPPWDKFSSLLNPCFGPKIQNTQLAAIKNLCQIRVVNDYEENFLNRRLLQNSQLLPSPKETVALPNRWPIMRLSPVEMPKRRHLTCWKQAPLPESSWAD
jgi:hypothetical protein